MDECTSYHLVSHQPCSRASKAIATPFLYRYQEGTTMDDTSWRSTVGDIPIRLMIVRKIQESFQEIQLPCEPEVLDETLSSLVPRLEAELYRTATSLEEYGDPRTVRERLERMAPHQGHVRPLEALWLQGLLNNNETTLGASSVEPEHVDAMTTEPAPQPLSTTIPVSAAAPSSMMPHPPEITIPAAAAADASCDGFARSLRELRQYLSRYDAFSNSIIVVTPRTSAIVLPEDFATFERTSAELTPSPDLKCHERLDDRL